MRFLMAMTFLTATDEKVRWTELYMSQLWELPRAWVWVQFSKPPPMMAQHGYGLCGIAPPPTPPVVVVVAVVKGRENPETDWDDKPGKPRRVIPVRFGVFWPERAVKTPETDW